MTSDDTTREERAIATDRASEPAAVPRSTGRILDLLETVVEREACNLTGAAAATGLTPTTALRHLRALEARGYVSRNAAGEFSPGPAVVKLAAVIHESGPLGRLIEAARPHLDELASTTGESTYLAVGDDVSATYVATAESTRAIRHVGWVGQSVPLRGSAVGAALADPTTPVMRTGVVEPDTTAIARALPGDDPLRAAVSVIGPTHRVEGDADRIIELLVSVTDRLAGELGLTTDGSVAS